MSAGRFVARALLFAGPLLAIGLIAAGWPAHFVEPAPATMCQWLRVAYAWVDLDRDGRQAPAEPPLAGVRFVVEDDAGELGGAAVLSDAQGAAVLAVPGMACGASGGRLVIDALPPPGYIANDAPVRGRGPGPYRFGFIPSD